MILEELRDLTIPPREGDDITINPRTNFWDWLNGLWDLIEKLIDALTGLFDLIIPSILEFILEIIKMIIDFLISIITRLWEVIIPIFNWIVTSVTAFFDLFGPNSPTNNWYTEDHMYTPIIDIRKYLIERAA